MRMILFGIYIPSDSFLSISILYQIKQIMVFLLYLSLYFHFVLIASLSDITEIHKGMLALTTTRKAQQTNNNTFIHLQHLNSTTPFILLWIPIQKTQLTRRASLALDIHQFLWSSQADLSKLDMYIIPSSFQFL